MGEKNKIFERIYANYKEAFLRHDHSGIEERIGVQKEDDRIIVPYYEKTCQVKKGDITDSNGKRPSQAVCVTLYNYLLSEGGHLPEKRSWVAYRDFRDAAPFAGAFSENVEAPLRSHFSGKLAGLEKSGAILGAIPPEADLPYDISLQFLALPRIPVLLVMNDADEEFPAHVSVLFDETAKDFLDMECLAMVGWRLTDRLLFYDAREDGHALA